MRKPEQGYSLSRKTRPVRIDVATLRLAEDQMDSCEACAPDLSQIPFDYIFDQITGCDPAVTDYVLPEPGRCPRCRSAVRTGIWRWYTLPNGARKVFVLPGTLVNLKK